MANPVFISYRRSDTTGEAGRLADSLENLLGAACVFRDADDIPAGEDFEVFLQRELAGTEVTVVLIGKKWLAELNHRLNQPNPDFVRIEIATALKLGKRVIPVLLQGAELPSAASLPDDLRALVNRQAINLRDEAWIADAGRLADAIGRPYDWRRLMLRWEAVRLVPCCAGRDFTPRCWRRGDGNGMKPYGRHCGSRSEVRNRSLVRMQWNCSGWNGRTRLSVKSCERPGSL